MRVFLIILGLLATTAYGQKKHPAVSELQKDRTGLFLYKDQPFTGTARTYDDKGNVIYTMDLVDGKKIGFERSWNAKGAKLSEVIWDEKGYKHSTYWFENGEKHYELDHRIGLRNEWYDNGQKKFENAGFYYGQTPHGKLPDKAWYRDGTVHFEGSFKDWKQHGEWKYYYPDGKMQRLEVYADKAVKTGEWKYWTKEGKPSLTVTYSEGRLNGPYTRWYKGGGKMWALEFTNGLKEGKAHFWTKEGEEIAEVNYKNDTIARISKTDKDLRLVLGYAMQRNPHCGGMYRPDPPPSPLSGRTYYFKKGDTNTVSKAIFSTTTDMFGMYMAYLGPGQYCMVGEDKYEELDLKQYIPNYGRKNGGETLAGHNRPGSADCYRRWWKRCDLSIDVTNKDLLNATLYFTNRCFVGTDPCASYHGPMPP